MTQKLTCRDVLEHCAACVASINTYKKTRELTGEVTGVAIPEDTRTRLRQSCSIGSAAPGPRRARLPEPRRAGPESKG